MDNYRIEDSLIPYNIVLISMSCNILYVQYHTVWSMGQTVQQVTVLRIKKLFGWVNQRWFYIQSNFVWSAFLDLYITIWKPIRYSWSSLININRKKWTNGSRFFPIMGKELRSKLVFGFEQKCRPGFDWRALSSSRLDRKVEYYIF